MSNSLTKRGHKYCNTNQKKKSSTNLNIHKKHPIVTYYYMFKRLRLVDSTSLEVWMVCVVNEPSVNLVPTRVTYV